MEENVVTGKLVTCRYYSLDEFADATARRANEGPGRASLEAERKWRGATLTQALKLAKTGWEERLTETISLMETSVSTVIGEHEVETFLPEWDVTGSEVDVARYLTGVPENMIQFPMREIPGTGPVITICAGVTCSAGIEPETIIRRGQVVAAFALLMSRIGLATELWIDDTIGSTWGDGSTGYKASIKVRIKGPNDILDPSKVLFAFAHPATQRALMFGNQHGLPSLFRDKLGIGGFYGSVVPIHQDLPEGTIYLPEIKPSGKDFDAAAELKEMLKTANLITE